MRRTAPILAAVTGAALTAAMFGESGHHSPTRGRPVGTPTGQPTALTADSAPAKVSRFAKTDPAGDMVKDSRAGVVAVPNHHNFDIRKVVVRHRAHRVTIRVNFEKLDVSGKPGRYGVSGYARVNPKAMPQIGGPGDPTPWEWELVFVKAHPHRPLYLLVTDAYYEEVYGCEREPGRTNSGGPAKKLAGRINYREDFLVASFPRRCFSYDGNRVSPTWVQVSVSNYGSGGAWDHWIKPTNVTYLDLRHLDRAYLSPRLYAEAGVTSSLR